MTIRATLPDPVGSEPSLDLWSGEEFPKTESPPYERKVIETLGSALQVIEESLAMQSSDATAERLLVGVQQGVSANLLEAIAGMHEDGGVPEAAVALSFSPRAPSSYAGRTAFKFEARSAETLKDVGRLLREREPIPRSTLRGDIVALEHEGGNGPRVVTIRAEVQGTERKIRCRLKPEAYGDAIEAHRRHIQVTVEGTLVFGYRMELLSPHNFRIVDLFR